MCVGLSAKVVKISEGTAVVDAGGAKREVSAQLLEDLEPGDYVLVSKWKKDNLAVGDLVLYEAPYYEIDGARYPLRRVVGARNGWIQVGCDADLVRDSVQLIPAEYVVGTAIGID